MPICIFPVLAKNGNSTSFWYGADRTRWQRTDVKVGTTTETTDTTYLGNVERIQKRLSTEVEWKRTVGGTIFTYKTNTSNQLLSSNTHAAYVFSDHLGSPDVITDVSGKVTHSMSFDPWGARRDGESWAALSDSDRVKALQIGAGAVFKQPITQRGFTGHEMVDDMGIIHMNGRIYDAKLGRFLQADPFVDGVQNTQGYNRYSYLSNNPLNATDPMGFFSLKKMLKIVVIVALSVATYGAASAWAVGMYGASCAVACSLATASMIGGIAGGAAAGFVAGVSAAAFSGANLKDSIKTGLKGASTGAVTGGFGSWANYGRTGSWVDMAERVAISSAGGCAAGEASGGSCSKGAKLAAAAQALSIGIEKFTTHKPTYKTPDSKSGVYKMDDSLIKDDLCQICDVPDPDVNNIGSATKTTKSIIGQTVADDGKWYSFSEGGLTSRGLASIPGFNSGGVTHDIFVGYIERASGVSSLTGITKTVAGLFTNQFTIAPVIGLNYYAAGLGNYDYYLNNLEDR